MNTVSYARDAPRQSCTCDRQSLARAGGGSEWLGAARNLLCMTRISDIRAPQDPNAADTFNSLRLVTQQHAAGAATYGAQRGGHADLVAAICRVLQPARAAIAVLEHAPTPTTPAGADARVRELAAQRDIERAYGELLSALTDACGTICAPV